MRAAPRRRHRAHPRVRRRVRLGVRPRVDGVTPALTQVLLVLIGAPMRQVGVTIMGYVEVMR